MKLSLLKIHRIPPLLPPQKKKKKMQREVFILYCKFLSLNTDPNQKIL